MRHIRGSNFRQVTDNCKLTVNIFTLKLVKDNERELSSFRYISQAIRLVCVLRYIGIGK